jgi:hydrogenase maturation protein HypF
VRRRLKIAIQGAVQGVGFRPFVFRLAREETLAGWILNDTRGVRIEVEGESEALDRFATRVAREHPSAAVIESLVPEWDEPSGMTGFEIRTSDAGGRKTVQVLPDIATCPECRSEVGDPGDRRHGYPFTNCTRCGPRFSIVRSLPYDRPRTTMTGFAMCEACLGEYENPLDRRFHAQPNACPVCGPRLELWDGAGNRSAGGREALDAACDAIRAGDVVAVKGLGGFHLAVDARSEAAVARLRAAKPRREKPFALMVRDLEQARELCELTAEDERALDSPESPILLLPRRERAPVADGVAPGNPRLGLMLPSTPLHHLLMERLAFPIVATSGNLSDEPICTDEREAVDRLRGVADRFLVHDRPIARHVDDSVAWTLEGETALLRRARGYAPRPVPVCPETPGVLAVGAHLKNAVGLGVGPRVFVSQHIGDMETPEALEAFERVVADFLRLYEVRPVCIAHDLHPDYATTRWAQRATAGDAGLPRPVSVLAGLPLIAVQHHHAHLASCLAEHGRDGTALGIIWDGTGYGTDGTVWGGEFLVGDAAGFRRAAALSPFRLPGGEAAVREPRRSALALLWETLGGGGLEREALAPVSTFEPAERELLARMLERGVGSPRTTSMGRLFDGVAALCGLVQRTSFEGQAAMALEHVVDTTIRDAYPVELSSGPDGESAPERVVDWRPVVLAVLDDLSRGMPVATIAARFHNAMLDALLAVAGEAGERLVVLSGGCFQNRLLIERGIERLRAARFDPLWQRRVPPNDGGIALGQVRVATARLQETREVAAGSRRAGGAFQEE